MLNASKVEPDDQLALPQVENDLKNIQSLPERQV